MSEELDDVIVRDASVTDEVVSGPRGAKAKKRWSPKEWKPEYTAIVALSCTGMSNESVGKHFNYTKVHVSNILSQPEAKQIRRLINDKLLEESTLSIPERLKRLQDIALKRVEDFVTSDSYAEKSPFQMFDRALKTLQGIGTLATSEPKQNGATTNIQNTQNNLVLSDAAAKTLSDGIAKAMLVSQIHAGIQPISVEPKKLTGLISEE